MLVPLPGTLTAKLDLQENVPLAPLTTLKIGGEARFFVKAATAEQVAAALTLADSQGLDLFVLGGGSNVLVSDSGFDGLVLQPALLGITYAEVGETASGQGAVLVTAQAGEDWDSFVEYCVERELAGIECLSGIPGWVGGTPVQNVGAYGQEVSETIVSVHCLDRQSAQVLDLSAAQCEFAYRRSIFNSTLRDRYIVLSVTFGLLKKGAPKLAYPELQKAVGTGSAIPTLSDVRKAVLNIRRGKSMVIDPDDANSRSAGSFFKNPVVVRSKLTEIEEIFPQESVPFYDAGNGMVKIPAAWLIEKAGFGKGFSHGNAGISSNHSLALINRGGAAAAELVSLKHMIVDAVKVMFGIELSPEPVFVGFE